MQPERWARIRSAGHHGARANAPSLASGRQRGFVTYDEILKAFPTIESDVMFLEELYEKWRKGAITDREVALGTEQARAYAKGVFQTMVGGSSLAVFSDRQANSAENCAENDVAGGLAQISANRSIQISEA